MFFAFAESAAAELPAWLNHILALWPVWATIAAGVGVLFAYRVYEKAGIQKTNQARIDSLNGLIETRDREIAELEDAKDALQSKHEILESEYKVLAGLVISELLIWAGNFERHKAETAAKDSEIRILKTRIGIMERREAENAEIHRTGP